MRALRSMVVAASAGCACACLAAGAACAGARPNEVTARVAASAIAVVRRNLVMVVLPSWGMLDH